MGNLIDRIVGFFNPKNGLRRLAFREALTRAYEGASKADGWRPKRRGASANADHAADASELRARSRALVQNVPYIAQGLRALVAQVIGTGIVPRWTGPGAEVFDQAWDAWAPKADADGRLDVYGLMALAYRTMEQDGEVLVRVRPRRMSDGLPVPIQFQVLEIDWLDSARNESRGGSRVVNGIQYDVLGKVEGYWLFDEHPGEVNSFVRRRTSSHFVPASSVIHLYTPERPGQGRGFPRIAPVISRVRDLQLYEDAELARKNLETRLSVLVSGDASLLANGAPTLSHDQAASEARATGHLGDLASGGINQVGDGMNMQVVEPKPAPGYVEYVKYQLHLIAAGWGVTYEMMTGDMREVSFTSARMRTMDFRREAEMTQWLHLIPRLVRAMAEAFADACELAGLVPKASYSLDYSTPKWEYVNPQQDVKADLEEIGGGLQSLSEKIRRRGYKPEKVFAELASDMKTLRELGLVDVLPFFKAAKADTEKSGTEQAN